MARKYIQTRRTEKRERTQRRIAEAALNLHSLYGPARTTFTMVAELANVQRHTLYAHFPDEKSLLLACSGLHLEQDPPPDPETWRGIRPPRQRLNAALLAIYKWYEKNEVLFSALLRDAEFHEPTREIVQVRLAPVLGTWRTSLAFAGKGPDTLAMLELALSFQSWRTLAREGCLVPHAAAAIMASAILSPKSPGSETSEGGHEPK